MLLQLKNYHMANESLFVMDAADKYSDGIVSKLSLQKMLYLAGVLSPFREVVMTFLKYSYHFRGPYSKDIQNTIDHLVATGMVDISGLTRSENGKALYVNYKITSGGSEAVRLLKGYSHEDEKHWWISAVAQLAYIYLKSEGLRGNVDHRIMSLVYQEPSFKQQMKGTLINLDETDRITNHLITFLKDYTAEHELAYYGNKYKRDAEIILLAFFEYLYLNYINEHGYE